MNSTTAPGTGDDPDRAFDERIRQLLRGAAETYAQRACLDERLQKALEASTGGILPGPEGAGSEKSPGLDTGQEMKCLT